MISKCNLVKPVFLIAALAVMLLAPKAEAEDNSGFKFSGFVDSGYALNFTTKANTFSLNEVELNLEKTFEGIATLRTDIQFRPADAVNADGKWVAPSFNEILEQGYVRLDVLKEKIGLTFTLGKFNAPLGVEKSDLPDRLYVSTSLLYRYGAPAHVTGIMLDWTFQFLNMKFFAFNGWDMIGDNNDAKSFGARIGASIIDGRIAGGVTVIYGPERDNEVGDNRFLIDVDLKVSAVKNLTVALEFCGGYEPGGSGVLIGKRARWLAVSAMIHYQIIDKLGVSLRYEHFDDPDGSRIKNKVMQTVEAVQVALIYTPHKNVMAFLEWRGEYSDAINAYEISATKSHTTLNTIKANLTLRW